VPFYDGLCRKGVLQLAVRQPVTTVINSTRRAASITSMVFSLCTSGSNDSALSSAIFTIFGGRRRTRKAVAFTRGAASFLVCSSSGRRQN
jgi:hypothetical protein